ncbi:KRAB-A domain-containing protein 2-like [Melitaea cinxia]|uniref:KRAB-A domain-containing protein 2-like n=1 Tax=Melitaea cinxia TaxID=113334 RepID=UPI001E26F936|nr:KRAB-A domain-containing protein 2-like [Melitaea cinxia]
MLVEFVNSVIKELTSYWPELKLVTGKPRHSQSQGSVERANQDIEKMLASWMEDNKTTNWSNGLKFVQFMKNRAFYSGIKQSPYQAMFGTEPKVGLTTSNLPLEIISRLHNEEDLKVAITEMNQNFDDNEENQDKQEKNETKKKQVKNKKKSKNKEKTKNKKKYLNTTETNQ